MSTPHFMPGERNLIHALVADCCRLRFPHWSALSYLDVPHAQRQEKRDLFQDPAIPAKLKERKK